MRGMHRHKSSRGTSKERALSVVDAAIETIKILRGFVPLEPAQGALDSLCTLLQLLQTHIQNQDDLSDIAERCQRVAYITKKVMENDQRELDDGMRQASLKLQTAVDSTLESIQQKRQRRTWTKVFRAHRDSEELQGLKEALRDFIAEFDIELGVVVNLDVKAILQWVKAQEAQKITSINMTFALFTPPKPPIFFGRDDVVEACVNDLKHPSTKHVVLIGTGGMGKSTIAKAILNEKSIVANFEARLFITYDGIPASSMTYQTFLNSIGESLGLSAPTSRAILQHLLPMNALLVIDNAESFLDAPESDIGLIYRTLEDIGAQSSTRIIITTRNTETIPPNLPCHRLQISGLDMEAARQAFLAVYPMPSFDAKIAEILSDLEHHPLSINILANVAVMNDWSPGELAKAWRERQTELLDGAQDDKYRSLRVTIELSIKAFKDRQTILELLRAIAFLPQGIHIDDLAAISHSADIIWQAERARRSSLIYRLGDRLTMLAPVRMYVANKYNHSLHYDDTNLSAIRDHYYGRLLADGRNFVQKEHANIDRILHFDLSSERYRSNADIRLEALSMASFFIEHVCYSYFCPITSLWTVLAVDLDNRLYDSEILSLEHLSRSLVQLCWAQYHRTRYHEALGGLEIAELFYRNHASVRNRYLMECMKLRGFIYQAQGKLPLAEAALQEGLHLTHSRGEWVAKALFCHPLSRLALRRGRIPEAKLLAAAAMDDFESDNQFLQTTPLLQKAEIHFFERDFDSARGCIARAMEVDQLHDDGKKCVRILNGRANLEAWAGNIAEAEKSLDEILRVEGKPGMPAISEHVRALRGKAYYQAIAGNVDGSRVSLEQASALAVEGGVVGSSAEVALTSAYVELVTGEPTKARVILKSQLDGQDEEDMQWVTILCRALGEVACVEKNTDEANAQFVKAQGLCTTMGIQPRFLYVGYSHWDALTGEYDGWSRYQREISGVVKDI